MLCELCLTVDASCTAPASAVPLALNAAANPTAAASTAARRRPPRRVSSPNLPCLPACLPGPRSAQPCGAGSVCAPLHPHVQHAPPAGGVPLWLPGGLCGRRRRTPNLQVWRRQPGMRCVLARPSTAAAACDRRKRKAACWRSQPLPQLSPLLLCWHGGCKLTAASAGGLPPLHAACGHQVGGAHRRAGSTGHAPSTCEALAAPPLPTGALHSPPLPPPRAACRRWPFRRATCWRTLAAAWWSRCRGGRGWPTRGSPSLGRCTSCRRACRSRRRR